MTIVPASVSVPSDSTVTVNGKNVTVIGPSTVNTGGTVSILADSSATADGETVEGPATIKTDGTVEEDGIIGYPNGDGVADMDDALEILNYVLEIGSEYIK